MEILNPCQGKIFIDATIGGGGHTEAILRAGACVIGIDRDIEAIRFVRKRLSREIEPCAEHSRIQIIQANFRDLNQITNSYAVDQVDGLLIDLGVSSPQLNTPRRGFSFQTDGPLDMRMDQNSGNSASDWIATTDEAEIASVLSKYGEEPRSVAKRVASAIVRAREEQPIRTTGQLTEVIGSVLPGHGQKTHFATRIFQGIRIALNDELNALQDILKISPTLLRPKGRIVVISFHSLEDRLVKNFFQETSTRWISRPDWADAKLNPLCVFKLYERRPKKASAEEMEVNPRSRSARLRWAEKL